MKKPPKDQELTAKVCAWASPFIMLFGITSASIVVFIIGLIFLVCGIWYLRD